MADLTSSTMPSCWRMRSFAWRIAKLLSRANAREYSRSRRGGTSNVGSGFPSLSWAPAGRVASRLAATRIRLGRRMKDFMETDVRLFGKDRLGRGLNGDGFGDLHLVVGFGDQHVERRDDKEREHGADGHADDKDPADAVTRRGTGARHEDQHQVTKDRGGGGHEH